MGDPSDLRYIPPESATTPIDWSKVPETSKKFLEGWARDWKTDELRPLPTTIGELAKRFHGSKFFGYMEPKRCTLLLDINEFGLAASPESPVGPRFYMKYLDEIWFVLFRPGKRDGAIGSSDKIKSRSEDYEGMGGAEISEGDDEGMGDMEVSGGDEDIEVKEGTEVSGSDEDSEVKEGNRDEGEEEDEEDEEDEEEAYKDYEEVVPPEEIAMAQAFDAKLEEQVRLGGIFTMEITHRLAGWKAETLRQSLQDAQLGDAMMSLPLGHPAQNAFLQNAFAHLFR